MKKKYLLFSLFLIILLSFSSIASAAPQISVVVNGKTLSLDSAPVIENNRTLVPLRGIFESLQSTPIWDGATKTVTANKGDVTIKLQIGMKNATKNGQTISLDVPPKIINNRTYVPLRFIGESFGSQVTWNSESKTIHIVDTKKELSIKDISKKKDALVLLEVYDKNKKQIGTGSGFIISSTGKVITNYHVIHSGFYVIAVTSDNKRYEISKVLNYDVDRDIAILQIRSGTTFPTVDLGDSTKMDVGDGVVAIGSPLGLQNTVSNGIISSIRTFDNYSYIQTSAPISPGSSGGALFNMYGEVIGVTVAQFEGQNLNLAIPINEVKDYLKTSRPLTLAQVFEEVWVSYEETTQDILDHFSSLTFKGIKVELDSVSISEDEEEPEYVYVYLDMNKENYDRFKQIGATPEGKKAIESWLFNIGEELNDRYPEKFLLGGFTYFQAFDTKPTGFKEEDIYYNEKTSKYEVLITEIIFDTFNGFVYIEWLTTK
jgi:S1-C subfamily serine protease